MYFHIILPRRAEEIVGDLNFSQKKLNFLPNIKPPPKYNAPHEVFEISPQIQSRGGFILRGGLYRGCNLKQTNAFVWVCLVVNSLVLDMILWVVGVIAIDGSG